MTERFWQYYDASMQWQHRLLNHEIDGLSLDRHLFDEIESIKLTTPKNENQNEEEVSSDFLDFIVATRKHQIERDRKKEESAREEANKVEYKDIAELEARSNLIGSMKPELREDLYGENANAILNKELRLQFAFNDFCDRHQPTFWPVIPINLKISQ